MGSQASPPGWSFGTQDGSISPYTGVQFKNSAIARNPHVHYFDDPLPPTVYIDMSATVATHNLPAMNKALFRDLMIDNWVAMPAAAKPVLKWLFDQFQAAAPAVHAWLCHRLFGRLSDHDRGICFESFLAFILRYFLYPAGPFIHHGGRYPRDFTLPSWHAASRAFESRLGEAKLAHTGSTVALADYSQDHGFGILPLPVATVAVVAVVCITPGEVAEWQTECAAGRGAEGRIFVGLWTEDGRILVHSKRIDHMLDSLSTILANPVPNPETGEPCYKLQLRARIGTAITPGPIPAVRPPVLGCWGDALSSRMRRPYQGSNHGLALPHDSDDEFIPTTGFTLEVVLHWGGVWREGPEEREGPEAEPMQV